MPPSRPRIRSLFLSMAMIGAACTAGGTLASEPSVLGTETDTRASDVASTDTTQAPSTTTTELPTCDEPANGQAVAPGTGYHVPSDRVDASRELSQAIFPCADTVTLLAPGAGEADLVAAVEFATAAAGPLMVVSTGGRQADLTEEINRLAPHEVVWFGPAAQERRVADIVNRPGGGNVANTKISQGPSPETLTESSVQLDAELARLVDSEPAAGIAVLAQSDPWTALTAVPALSAAGLSVTLANAEELDPLFGIGPVVMSDAFTSTERWRIDATAHGSQLPGGGLDVFPTHRIVAFYGSPVTFRLGLLGERSPEATVERLKPVVESYAVDDTAVYGGFELIATVADRKPGDDGDYSNELEPDELRPWIDIAVANDLFVVIDLQPGRTDFLTQAKRYEEFLRLPNVGLALDPEWRIGPNERHLVRIGDVKAAEVNQVVDWLAQLVREEKSPQKILVLHQFLERMLPDRHLIKTPDEVAVVVHVDGQGGLFSKYDTYDEMTDLPQAADQTLWWGWKNFLDEDRPVARPDQVFTERVDPAPVIITFQ